MFSIMRAYLPVCIEQNSTLVMRNDIRTKRKEDGSGGGLIQISHCIDGINNNNNNNIDKNRLEAEMQKDCGTYVWKHRCLTLEL